MEEINFFKIKRVRTKHHFLYALADKSKMNESNKPANYPDDEGVAFIDGDSGDEVEEKSVEEPFPNTVKILESENGGKVYLIGNQTYDS